MALRAPRRHVRESPAYVTRCGVGQAQRDGERHERQVEEATMSGPSPATRVASPDAAPQTQRPSRMAVWSLVLSIITLGGLGSLAGIWLGFTARRRIAETGEHGSGVAVAGIVV